MPYLIVVTDNIAETKAQLRKIQVNEFFKTPLTIADIRRIKQQYDLLTKLN
jgi:hypothetical protein